MMIGPIVNGVGIIAGSSLGALYGNRIPANLKERLPMVFGLVSMGLGISMLVKAQTLTAVVLSLLIGTIAGELLRLEDGIQHLAAKARGVVDKFLKPSESGISHEEFLEKFVAMIILFSASGMGIFGAMNEGMRGDYSLLLIKAFLDFFTAAIFAASLGFTLAVAAIPQFLIQTILFLGAGYILPLTNPVIIADFSAVGGLIMLATGFRICGLIPFAVANMLPALLLAMPFSALWIRFIS